MNSNIVDDESLYVYTGEIKDFPDIDNRVIKEDLLVLKYIKGNGFPKHSHLKITDEHIGDLIIFPPISILPESFTGGDLIVYHDTGLEIIRTDNLTEWKVVFLKLGIPHEVTPITHGIRYAFKYDIFNE